MRQPRHPLVCLIALVVLSAAARDVSAAGSGPRAPGAVSGRVTDATGAALPGVLVEASLAPASPRTGAPPAGARPTRVITGSDGGYRFESLPAGRYILMFRLVGFADRLQTGVALPPGGSVGVDAQLQVALASDVTVSARGTFLNLAEIERPEESLVGFASAASQGAVTGRQIATRPLMRTGEVLETVPGVIVSQHSGEGKANQYYLRGFNLDHGTDFATSVAGMPVNLPTHGHGHGYTDVNFVMPELVSGVQFRKGPYYAEDGDFSSAGSASLTYLNAIDAPMAIVSAGQGGWGRLFAAASPRVAGGHLLAAVDVAHHDGPWARPDDYSKRSAVLRYSRGTSLNGWSITGMGYDATWSSTDQAPARALIAGALSRFGAIDESSGGATHRYSLSAEWQRADSRRLVRASAYVIDYGLDLFSNFTYALDDPEHGDQFEQRDRRVISGARISTRLRRSLFGRAVEHTAGTQIRHDAIGEVGLYRTQARLRLATIRQDRVGQTSAGVFVQSELRLHDRVRAMAGLRGDLLRVSVRAGDPRNGGRDVSALASPKAGLVLGPWQKTELYLNAGTGFHSNDARGATITIDPATGLAADRVTPLVRARGAEVGLRTVVIPKVQSTLALWRLDLDSELVFVGDAGTTEAGRPSRRQGLEWATVMTPARWLTLDVDLAWSSAAFTDGDPVGARVPGAVRTVVSAGAVVDGPWRVSGGLRWRYFGARPLTEEGGIESAATSLVNANLGVRVSPRARLQLDAFNLFDAQASDIDYFYVSRLPGEPAEGVADRHTHPSLPRTVRLSLCLRF